MPVHMLRKRKKHFSTLEIHLIAFKHRRLLTVMDVTGTLEDLASWEFLGFCSVVKTSCTCEPNNYYLTSVSGEYRAQMSN